MLPRPSSSGEKTSSPNTTTSSAPTATVRSAFLAFTSSFILPPSSLLSHVQLDRQSQDFGHAPGLGRAADRAVREIGLEDLADLPDAGVGFQVLHERPQPGPRLLQRLRDAVVDLEVGVEKAADEPGPD